MSGGPVPVWKKYTTRPTGIWEKIRQWLVLVPNRSSGNPVVEHFRAVPPGARIEEAKNYKDPVTIPAGDIRGNPYYKRDYRRNYPQIRAFDQTKVSGLLTLGNAEKPRISIGEKGSKELAAFSAGTSVSLASTLTSADQNMIKGQVLGYSGEPIVAPSLHKFKWKILQEPEHGMYTDDYPCRTFTMERPTQ
ncbi:hypothetical protein OXX59_002288 [Metschnikowia pulcherrima]